MPKPMTLRNVRMSDDLWTDVQALAAVRDVRTADLVRDTLESLVRRNRKVIDEHKAAHDAPSPDA